MIPVVGGVELFCVENIVSSFEVEFGLNSHVIAGEERAWKGLLCLNLFLYGHFQHLDDLETCLVVQDVIQSALEVYTVVRIRWVC